MKKPYLIIFAAFFACLSVFAFGKPLKTEAHDEKEINYVQGSGCAEFSVEEYGLTGIKVYWKTYRIDGSGRCVVTGNLITFGGEYLESLFGATGDEPISDVRFNIRGTKDGQEVEIVLTVLLKTEGGKGGEPDENGDGGDNGENENGGDDTDGGGEGADKSEGNGGGDTTDGGHTQNTPLPKRTPNSTFSCRAASFAFLPLLLIGIIKKKG